MIDEEEKADPSSQTIGAKTDMLRHKLLERCLELIENKSLELSQMKFCRDVIKEMEDYTPSTPEALGNTKPLPFGKQLNG